MFREGKAEAAKKYLYDVLLGQILKMQIKKNPVFTGFFLVGDIGFEPMTSNTSSWHSAS